MRERQCVCGLAAFVCRHAIAHKLVDLLLCSLTFRRRHVHVFEHVSVRVCVCVQSYVVVPSMPCVVFSPVRQGGADDPGPAMAVALALFWNVSFLLLLLAQVTGYPGAVEV